MKGYDVQQIRSFTLIGHSGDGKTTLAEAILRTAGAIGQLGRTGDGTSHFDFEKEEIEHKISINSAMGHTKWGEHFIHFVDAPGDANFLSDAQRALQATDGAILVVSAVTGIKVNSERLWAYAKEFGTPVAIFFNMMDREFADFSKVLDDVKNTLDVPPVPFTIPIGAAETFEGVIDLIAMKALRFPEDASGRPKAEPIPEDLEGTARDAREKLVEAAAEADDALTEKYLEEGTLTEEEILRGLRLGTISGKLVPVLAGSAEKNIGVSALLDLVRLTFPSPADRPALKGSWRNSEVERGADPAAPFSALVFKTSVDPYAGHLSIFRVVSGTLRPDTNVSNASQRSSERIAHLLLLQGKKQEQIEEAGPGDLLAVAKLKGTATGDTLCAEKKEVVFQAVPPPPPLISYAIQPRSKGEEDKVATALGRLAEEDPTLRLTRQEQTKEFILEGMGQVHVDIALKKLKRKFGVEVLLRPPKMAYRETIKGSARGIEGKVKKQTGGRGQFGVCYIHLDPAPREKKLEFVNNIVGGAIPRNFIPAVEKGIVDAMEKGPLAGYPVVGVQATLYDGKFHDVDSSEMAFKVAGSLAFKTAFILAKPILLEPIMNMEIRVPEENMGDCIGNLNSRRGKVAGVDSKGKTQIIRVSVPQAEVLRYAPDLTSMTSGRGTFTMEFSHYEEVPAHVQEKITAASKKPSEDEKK